MLPALIARENPIRGNKHRSARSGLRKQSPKPQEPPVQLQGGDRWPQEHNSHPVSSAGNANHSPLATEAGTPLTCVRQLSPEE